MRAAASNSLLSPSSAGSGRSGRSPTRSSDLQVTHLHSGPRTLPWARFDMSHDLLSSAVPKVAFIDDSEEVFEFVSAFGLDYGLLGGARHAVV